MNLWVARFPVLALAGFALCLTLAVRGNGAIARLVAGAPRVSLICPTVAVGLLTAGIVADPTIASGSAPIPGEESIRLVLLATSAIALLVTGAVHWNRWRLGRDRIELALVMASWLTMSALLSLEFGRFWRLSWWDYHLYLLTGFAAAAWAVVVGYRRSRSLAGAVGGITVRDPIQQAAQGHPDAMQALIGAVEAKDPYTHGHSERVAELSTRIGLRLDLPPEAVRGLHQGAFLHDVGKISVPDQILNKPDELQSGGVDVDRTAPRGRLGSREPRRVAPRRPVGDPPSPRALGRHGVPRSAGGNRDTAARPDRGRRGRLGRLDVEPRVSTGLAGGPGRVAHRGRQREPLRSGGRRGLPRYRGRDRALAGEDAGRSGRAAGSLRRLPPGRSTSATRAAARRA